MMKAIAKVALVLFGLIVLAVPAAAQSLESAKASGQIGELPNGYLAAVGSQPPAVQRLVDEINLKRREQYRQIAQRNGTSLAAVEKLAGEKLIERARPGEYVADAAGNWQRK